MSGKPENVDHIVGPVLSLKLVRNSCGTLTGWPCTSPSGLLANTPWLCSTSWILLSSSKLTSHTPFNKKKAHLSETNMRSRHPHPQPGTHSLQETRPATPCYRSEAFSDQSLSYTKQQIGYTHTDARPGLKCVQTKRLLTCRRPGLQTPSLFANVCRSCRIARRPLGLNDDKRMVKIEYGSGTNRSNTAPA